MGNKNLARRVTVKLYFKGKDISKELSKYLISMTYTDNEEDKADDISLTLDDREGRWIKDWLYTGRKKKTITGGITKAGSTTTTGNITGLIHDTVIETEKDITVQGSGSTGYSLKGQDNGGTVKTKASKNKAGTVKAEKTEENTKRAFKGTEIHALVVQKNFLSDGKDKVLDCGVFEIDEVSCQGPPQKLTIKATSIPYKTHLRQTRHRKAWENTSLKNIASKIAKRSGMKIMYISKFNPVYKRKEQKNKTDIAFLKMLCKKAGISLKVTSKIIVLFDAAEFEKKNEVKKITAGKSNITSYSFSTKTADKAYSGCHVQYTDPRTKKKTEYTYKPGNASKDGQMLEIKQKVSNIEEAKVLAKKSLRQKNKGETTAEFTLVGDVGYVAGITVRVKGFGEFDGKYIVEQAVHTVTGGYKVQVKLRSCLEGY